MRRATVVLALVVLAALSVGAEILEQVLVKVNGEILTKTDLETRQVTALRQRLRQNVSPQDLKRDEELRKALDEITPQLLVDAVDELLLMQRGKELGYRMGDEQFNSIVANIRKENKLEDEEQFKAALKQEGISIDDLRKSLERQMIFSRVQQVEVYGRIAVSEDEAKKLLRGALDRVHDALQPDDSRDPPGGAERGAAGAGQEPAALQRRPG